MPKDSPFSIFWSEQSPQAYSAPKVRRDIMQILKSMGAQVITHDDLNSMREQLLVLQYPMKPYFNVTQTNTIEPFQTFEALRNHSEKLVVFVHDIKSLQAPMFDKEINDSLLKRIGDFEKMVFESADYLIVHSDNMGDFLSRNYKLIGQIIPLTFFDYLGKSLENRDRIRGNEHRVAFTGYLGPAKTKLVKGLYEKLPISDKLRYNLYGADMPIEAYSRVDIAYRGVIPPDDLPSQLGKENDSGLLWDTLDERRREYYAMIMPHKCSLYVRAGLPMVVPDGTNASAIVLERGIGCAIESLDDIVYIPDMVKCCDIDTINDLGEKMAQGYFTRKAINTVLENES